MIGRLLALVAALICVAASPSYADDFSRGLVVGKIQASTITAACHAVGCALSVPNVPGATYQWFNGGVAVSGATSNSYTPTSAGDISVTITLNRQTVSSAITITGTPAATATVGQAYSFSPTISGGSGSGYSVAFTGSYPPGITKDSATGNLGGSPTTAGTYSGLGETASDSLGNHASLTPFQITVSAAYAYCPMGTGYADTCTSIPATDGVTIFPAFFTASATNGVYQTGVARESGQGAYHRPPFNVTGVDFGVGYSPSQVAAMGGWKDPVAATAAGGALALQGCRNDGGGTTGGPRIRCDQGGNNLDIEGYDFSGQSSLGTPSCIPLLVWNNNTGTVKAKNNRFINGSNCTNNAVLGTGYVGNAFNAYVPDPTNNPTAICVGTQTRGTGGIAVGNKIDVLGGFMNRETPATIQASSGGTCDAGYSPYTMSALLNPAEAGAVIGSSASPATLGIESNKLVVTTTSGTIQTGFLIQGVDGAAGTISATGCSPTCGGPGSYTITLSGTTYGANEPITMGKQQPMFNMQGNVQNSGLIVSQNYFDGHVAGIPDSQNLVVTCALCLASAGSAVVTDNAMFRCNCRPEQVAFTNGTNTYSLDVERNYIEEWGMNYTIGHLEATVASFPTNAHVTLQKYYNNTILTSPDTQGGHGTAAIWLGTGVAGPPIYIDNSEIAFNTVITNTSNLPINLSSNVVNGLIERQDGTWTTATNVHDNWIDGTGMLGCIGYDAASVGPITFANNYSLLSGLVQSNYGTAYACKSPNT